ncbi:MAG: ribonuclease R [Bacillota bacterium]
MDFEEKREERKKKIIGFMNEAAYKPMKLSELAVMLDVPPEDRKELAEILGELERDGAVFRTSKDRYGLPERMNLITGRIQGNERGYGFLVPDDDRLEDVFIPADGMAGAMHNDRVVARITARGSVDKRAEGEVIRILKRSVEKVVGTYEKDRYFGFVVPDDRRIPGDVFIPADETNGAKPGDKVVVEIVRWPDTRRNAEGRIVEILGESGQAGIDILSVIKAYGLRESFPEAVIRQAEAIPDKIDEQMMKGRQDLRGLRMVTIDGEDAKDLDDAVSVQRLPDGGYRLGVHIADVSYYVAEGTPLDCEALMRGTSVYLVDRVLPMLPTKLSNGVCSLNPREDRLAFTVMMDLDDKGKVTAHDIFESVINVNERMTYTDVYKLLEADDNDELDSVSPLVERYGYLLDDFRLMRELAMILYKKREARGAIDFDFPEAKIILDDKGKPVEVKKYEITIANRIIEEFMLVCNETVAEHFHWAGIPFVYRIHEEPETEKITAFAEFSKTLGYPVKGIRKIHPKSLQDVLRRVKGSREETVVSTAMLRSLAKARYSDENMGHFGLAAKFYCHFTSPIRRYPDLIIHRLMKEELKGRLTDEREAELLKKLPEIARICSERERAADEAERETENIKKVEFMEDKVGETFDAIVSGVTSFGMFVELDNTVEGLVGIGSMEDDYYIYDEKNYCLIGERTKKRYRIGDAVRVILVRADVGARRLDFAIAEPDDSDEQAADNGKSKKVTNGKRSGAGWSKGVAAEKHSGKGARKAAKQKRRKALLRVAARRRKR